MKTAAPIAATQPLTNNEVSQNRASVFTDMAKKLSRHLSILGCVAITIISFFA